MKLFGIDVAVTHWVRREGAPFFEAYQGGTKDDYEIHLGSWWVVASWNLNGQRGVAS